jgi:hypothetical protein
MVLREIIQMRSTSRRWVYILCGIIVVSVAVLSAGLEGTSIAGFLFLPLVLICIVQYLRPTLLLWALLMLAFLAYMLGIATHLKELTTMDDILFSLVGLVPCASPLWAWPHADVRT